jgi:hypothetical protein
MIEEEDCTDPSDMLCWTDFTIGARSGKPWCPTELRDSLKKMKNFLAVRSSVPHGAVSP